MRNQIDFDLIQTVQIRGDLTVIWDVLRYLDHKANSLDIDGYEWREIGGLIENLKTTFGITHDEYEATLYPERFEARFV